MSTGVVVVVPVVEVVVEDAELFGGVDSNSALRPSQQFQFLNPLSVTTTVSAVVSIC